MKNQFNWKLLGLAGMMVLWPLFGAAQVNLDSGLVAYYPFNGNANDESGNGNNAIVNNATLTTDRLGIENRAYEFNGSNSWLNLGDNVGFHLFDSTSITLFAWIRITPNHNDGNIFRYDDGDNSDGDVIVNRYLYLFRTRVNGKLTFQFGDPFGNFAGVNSDSVLETNKWYAIAAVRDVSTDSLMIYIGGEKDASTEDPTTGKWETSGQYLMSGRYVDGGQFSLFYSGMSDELRIYNRALNSEEITELSNQTATNIFPEMRIEMISLSPNPAPGTFTLRSPQAAIQSLDLYDLTGRHLPTEISHDRHEAQVQSLYRGIAIVKVQTDMGMWVQKVVLE